MSYKITDIENVRMMSEHVRSGECYRVLDEDLKRTFGDFIVILDIEVDELDSWFEFSILKKGIVKRYKFPIFGTMDASFLLSAELIS